MDIHGKRVAIYVRVSTEEQARHGLSVGDQLTVLRQWVSDGSGIPAGEYVDEGYSARKSYRTRPALQRLLAAVQAGQIDVIAFTKLDRWSRKVADYHRMQEVLEQARCSWVAILEDYETITTDGRFKVSIMLAVNEQEADRTSDRIKFTMAQKKARGEICSGNMPKGYILLDKKPVKDPDTMAGVDAFWRTYLLTGSMIRSQEAAAEAGLRIRVSSGSFMLTNAAHYAGSIQGVPCEPYITEAERDLVLSTRKKKPRSSPRIYLFSGILKCGECGHRMGGHAYSLKSRQDAYYYNCPSRYAGPAGIYCSNSVNITEDDIEQALLTQLDSALADAVAEAETKAAAAKADDNSRQIARLQARRDRGWEAYLDGIVTKEEFEAERKKIDAQLAELSQDKKIPDPQKVQAILPADWQSIYNSFDRTHKRAFWLNTLQYIYIHPDRSITFDFLLP